MRLKDPAIVPAADGMRMWCRPCLTAEYPRQVEAQATFGEFVDRAGERLRVSVFVCPVHGVLVMSVSDRAGDLEEAPR